MAAYKYQPIDLDTSGVRLLQLFRGNFGDEIRCELFDGWISQARDGFPYEALSYTWGSTEKAAQITVNGSIMRVTSNLFTALQHLRFEDEDRVMWIDAICIDQENLEERRHQVQHMSDIYKEAERVVVWLGEGTKETDLVMDFMKLLQEAHIKVEGDWRRLAPFWIGMGDIREQEATLFEGMKLMLSRPWFRRIWILQEIANARVATIHCGVKSVSARIFAQFPSIIGLKPDSSSQAVLDIMPGLSRKESWWGQDRKLHNLLIKFRESEATDLRDVIYALLGISSDACQSNFLLPDYTKSLQEVVWDTTSFLLFHTEPDRSLFNFLPWTLADFFLNLDSLSIRVFEVACDLGQAAPIEFLLGTDKNINLDLRDDRGRTPLHRAARHGHEFVVRLLLDRVYGESEASDDWESLLFKASQHEHRPSFQVRHENDTRIEARDTSGRTPLSYAAQLGTEAVVSLLLTNGADIESRDEIDRTPLSHAISEPNELVARLLLENGAEIESKDINDRTPLFYAVSAKCEPVVRLLIESGAEIETEDCMGRTPLYYAIEYENNPIVQLLLDKGAKVTTSWTVSSGELEEMKEYVREEFEA